MIREDSERRFEAQDERDGLLRTASMREAQADVYRRLGWDPPQDIVRRARTAHVLADLIDVELGQEAEGPEMK